MLGDVAGVHIRTVQLCYIRLFQSEISSDAFQVYLESNVKEYMNQLWFQDTHQQFSEKKNRLVSYYVMSVLRKLVKYLEKMSY